MNVLEPIQWAALLMLVGCLLILLEFFIPSGGILGALATLSIVVSIVIAFYSKGAGIGLVFVITAAVGVPTLVGLALKYWPMTPMGKAFLGEPIKEEDVLPEDDRKALIGRIGIAKSKMLPSGAVEIDGRIIDAVTQGISVEPGDRVIVFEVRGNHVIVRPAGGTELNTEPNKESIEQETPNEPISEPIKDFEFDGFDDPLT